MKTQEPTPAKPVDLTQIVRRCIVCEEEYPGSWTGECDDCEKSTLALWLNFAYAEKNDRQPNAERSGGGKETR